MSSHCNIWPQALCAPSGSSGVLRDEEWESTLYSISLALAPHENRSNIPLKISSSTEGLTEPASVASASAVDSTV